MKKWVQYFQDMQKRKELEAIEYQLNLILKDSTRINFVNYEDLYDIQQNVKILADKLGVPVWDISDI